MVIRTRCAIEHSGLGRYGEALNPWGDLITMAKAWCLTKQGGKFLIGKSNTYEEFYITLLTLLLVA